MKESIMLSKQKKMCYLSLPLSMPKCIQHLSIAASLFLCNCSNWISTHMTGSQLLFLGHARRFTSSGKPSPNHIATRHSGRIGRAWVSWVGDCEFKPMVESNEWLIKCYTCRFLARCSALLGKGSDWLDQCQDNATEWDIRSWSWRPGFPVG